MKIGLIDVDGHGWPNLCLMKISAYHKARGDVVEWWNGLKHYDVVYKSKVFDQTYSRDMEHCVNADMIKEGGTGYGLNNKLPEAVEHSYPDYSLYRFQLSKGAAVDPYQVRDTAYGFLSRGCPRGCGFCVVSEKESHRSEKVADLAEFWNGQKTIKLLDPNLLACPEAEKLLEQLANSKAYVDFTQGLDIRLIDRGNVEMLNRIRIRRLHFAWDDPAEDLTECFQKFNKHARIQDPSKKIVYVLTNFSSSHEQDLYRIYTLRDLGFSPYVMIYDKPKAPKKTKMLQRWCNNRRIFGAQPDFEKYDPTGRREEKKT